MPSAQSGYISAIHGDHLDKNTSHCVATYMNVSRDHRSCTSHYKTDILTPRMKRPLEQEREMILLQQRASTRLSRKKQDSDVKIHLRRICAARHKRALSQLGRF